MSRGLYRTVMRRTGGPIPWLAIRMCGNIEKFRALGETRDRAVDNLKNYESHRKSVIPK